LVSLPAGVNIYNYVNYLNSAWSGFAQAGFAPADTSKKVGDAADSKRRLVAVSFCQRVTPKRQQKSHFSPNRPSPQFHTIGDIA
jgi:hypothetical protein